MPKDRIGTKLTELEKMHIVPSNNLLNNIKPLSTIIFIDKILRAYSICYLPYDHHLTPPKGTTDTGFSLTDLALNTITLKTACFPFAHTKCKYM